MLHGKGMWMWIVQRCGEPTAIAAKAKAGGLSHMLIKLADGPYAYYGKNYGDTGNRDWTMQMVQACKAVGIDPVCWQYVYGVQPIAEANKVIERMNGVGIKKLVIDAETEYKAPGMGAKAVQYCQRLHTLMPDIALGLASYRFPTLHREFPWAEFGQFVDCYVPQVYWQGSHNPVEQLGRCIREYANLPYPNKPIFPAGSAYREYGWQPNPGEVTAFLISAKDVYGITAANLWEWYDATIRIPEYWNNEISVFDYGEQPEPPEPPEPPGIDLPEYFIVNTSSLKIRSTPEELANNSNFIGWTYLNAKWKPLSVVYDSKSREWWKINEYGYVARWLTKW